MIEVRESRIQDVAEMVQIHLDAFPDFFLSSLGRRFLARLYRAFVQDTEAICIVPCGQPLDGFVVGPLNPARFYRRLFVREGLGFAIDAMPAVLARPLATIRRLAAGAFFRGDLPAVRASAALISSIAVRPSASRRGIAGVLLKAFCKAAGSRGIRYVYLTTDRDENLGVNQFYSKHGFEIESEIVRPDGRVMNRYVRCIEEPGSSSTAGARGEVAH